MCLVAAMNMEAELYGDAISTVKSGKFYYLLFFKEKKFYLLILNFFRLVGV